MKYKNGDIVIIISQPKFFYNNYVLNFGIVNKEREGKISVTTQYCGEDFTLIFEEKHLIKIGNIYG